jgi:hypothetical protein
MRVQMEKSMKSRRGKRSKFRIIYLAELENYILQNIHLLDVVDITEKKTVYQLQRFNDLLIAVLNIYV